jgi:hypothetical protein
MRTSRLGAVLLALALVGAAACGSDTKKAATTSSSAKSSAASSAGSASAGEPSAAEVATGLKAIQKIASDVAAAASDKTKALQLDEGIEPVWKKIEGVIKANDEATYIALEDAFGTLSEAATAGDPTKAKAGSDAAAKAITAYLAKYPG